MGWLTERQAKALRAQAARVAKHHAKLRSMCVKYSKGRLHSQACNVGGTHAGGCAGFSGETPCPCGGEDADYPPRAVAS